MVSFGDNLSEILALESGRARDWELNAICRRAAGMKLYADIDWRRRHIISNANLTNFDSRLADVGYIAPGQLFAQQTCNRFLYDPTTWIGIKMLLEQYQ